MTRKSLSTKERQRLFLLHHGRCHLCGGKINGAVEAWDVEHVNPLFLSGDESDENRQPAHKKCHAAKTAKDAGDIARAKRREAKHLGAKARTSRFPGSRSSGFKIKLDRTVVRRGT